MDYALDLIPSLKVAIMKFQTTGRDEDMVSLLNIINDIEEDVYRHWRGVRDV